MIRAAALSFRSGEHGYSGLFALPGDDGWRQCRDAAGRIVWHDSADKAEADAGRRMVAAINGKDSRP